MTNTSDHSGNMHMGHLDLMPVDASGHASMATHVAVNDGGWFNPATWANGQVPGQGALVHIPEGVSVSYEGTSDVSLFMVRVDGALSVYAEDGAATKMVVDTIVTSETSYLGIQAQDATDGTVDIVFQQTIPGAHHAHYGDYSNGDGVIGRYGWDPDQLSLGLVASGKVDIKGQDVESGLKLAEGPGAGATQLVFDMPLDDPGWAIGQQIVVGGTVFSAADENGAMATQDEVRTITGIDMVGGQMVVTIDNALAFDHTGPQDPTSGLELTGYVGNLTRNVTLSSAVADQDGDGIADRGVSLGDTKGPGEHYVTERAHTMFMHNDDVSVLNTAFFGLGRTDKSTPVDDIVTGGLHDNRILQDNGTPGVFDPETDTFIETEAHLMMNARGRYAIHIHEANHHEGHEGHDHGDHGDGMSGPGVLGPCPETHGPICHCGDQDGDGIGDCYDDDYFEGAYLEGNVVWGSPGWGLVQHSSNAVLDGNLAYDVAGSAFVAELGDEAGRWEGNLAIGTYGAEDRKSHEDAEQFNEDGGTSGNGFYLKSRIIEMVDNVAQSSGRAGFMYHTEGGGLRDPKVEHLGELASLAIGGEPVKAEALPITTFEGNEVIAAREGIRIIADPSDSVRKMNDAWSVMKDFLAWEIDEAGVSVTYSSKYVFEDFTILGTSEKLSDGAKQTNAGFYFKASAADMTVVNSHVESFQNAVTNWTQVGNRQEYRRGYWDPKSPTDLTWAPKYEGMGTIEGIENPAWNLWNTNVIGLTYDDLVGGPVRSPAFEVETTPGTTVKKRGTEIWNSTDDVPGSEGVQIELLGDSQDGGLVALWREDIANNPNQQAMLAEHIPLGYRDAVYLGQVRLGSEANWQIRQNFTQHVQGINDDIWSGTVLEFAKEDSLGRQVFMYGDFAPLTPDLIERSVTTNERLILTKEMIDGVLVEDGYHTVRGISDVRFVVVEMAFSDRLTGEMEMKKILVALDQAWELPDGTVDGGTLLITDGMVVAEQYRVFNNGVLDDTRAPIVLGDTPDGVTAYQTGVFTTDADDQLNLGAGEDKINAGAGDDVVRGFAAADRIEGGAGRDALFGGDGWDRLMGGDDDDLLDGAVQRDFLYGGAGQDRLQGGTGRDMLDGGEGHDDAAGGAGKDEVFGRAGDDVLDGGNGKDTVDGGEGTDQVSGGLGWDIVRGGAGDDVVAGNAGKDSLYGDEGADLMNGGAGADSMWGGTGIDLMLGGSGADQMHGEAGSDTLRGEFGQDQLFGGADGDILDGGSGADDLDGGDGADILIGGRGRDTMTGGTGGDKFVFDEASGQDVITDFEDGVDAIEFMIQGFGFSDMTILRDGADTVIRTTPGQNIRLVDTDADLLDASDFNFLS